MILCTEKDKQFNQFKERVLKFEDSNFQVGTEMNIIKDKTTV